MAKRLEVTVIFDGSDADYWNFREAVEKFGGTVLQSRPI